MRPTVSPCSGRSSAEPAFGWIASSSRETLDRSSRAALAGMPGSEAGQDRQAVEAPILEVEGRERHRDVEPDARACREIEPLRHHPDDHVVGRVDAERLPDDVTAAAEALLPEPVAEDGDAVVGAE